MRQRLGTRGSCDRAAGERRGRQRRRCQWLGSCQCHRPRAPIHSPGSNTPRGFSRSLQTARGALREPSGGAAGRMLQVSKVDAPSPAWAGAKLLPRVLPFPGCFPTQNLPGEPEEPTPNPVTGTGWASRGASAEPRCHILMVATGAPQPGPLFPLRRGILGVPTIPQIAPSPAAISPHSHTPLVPTFTCLPMTGPSTRLQQPCSWEKTPIFPSGATWGCWSFPPEPGQS